LRNVEWPHNRIGSRAPAEPCVNTSHRRTDDVSAMPNVMVTSARYNPRNRNAGSPIPNAMTPPTTAAATQPTNIGAPQRSATTLAPNAPAPSSAA
jgi:hypothetical protein